LFKSSSSSILFQASRPI